MIRFIIANILFVYCTISADAIFIQKPKTYQGYENTKGWCMSEKLDGIRGYWNGKQLLTKNGNVINAPKWFTHNFPPFVLDGELWSKRDDFENIQSIVLDFTPSKEWNQISYQIFEVPKQDGNFTQRLNIAKKWFLTNKNMHVKFIEQILCSNKGHLSRYLKKIEKMNGEGVIIKDASLQYFTGRSSNILKIKSFADMEGEVIGINPGKGKFENLMGSLTIRLENGVVFRLGGGFDLNDRINPPLIGNIITLKYYGFTKNNKPKFASFIRVKKLE